MIQTKDYKIMTAGVVAAMVLVALFVRTVIAEIEYQRQADFGYLPDYTYVFFSLGPLSLAAIVGGFWFMRKTPTFGALAVTFGSIALAIMTYWLIVPVPLAIGLSFYAIRRAGRVLAKLCTLAFPTS